MLHNDPPVSTPVDNSGDRFIHHIRVITAAAAARDASIDTIERITRLAVDAGCDPVRLRQAAGVL